MGSFLETYNCPEWGTLGSLAHLLFVLSNLPRAAITQLNHLPSGFYGSEKKDKYVEGSILAPGQLIRSLYIVMILRAIIPLFRTTIIHLFIAFLVYR